MNPRFSCMFAALGVVALISCAGDPPKPQPPHLAGGAEQIAKGNAAYSKGCYAAAFERFNRAYELYSASDQPLGVAMSLNNMANIYRALGEPGKAMGVLEEAELLYSESGENTGLRQALANKSAALADLGRLDDAEKAIDKALKLNLPDNDEFLPLMVNRGIILTRRGDFKAAGQVLGRAIEKAAKAGAPDAAAAYYAMGRLLLETGSHKEAARLFLSALKEDQVTGFYAGLADDLQKLGDAYIGMGDGAAALNCWKRSVRIYALLGRKEDTEALMGKIRSEAAKAGASLDVIEAFVLRYQGDKNRDRLCE